MSETDTKAWYTSKTIIAGFIALAMAILQGFGFTLPEGEGETVTQLIVAIVTALAGILAIAGRITASKRLTK